MDVKCPCNICSGHLEFDRSAVGSTVACPHCGMDTVLFIPKVPVDLLQTEPELAPEPTPPILPPLPSSVSPLRAADSKAADSKKCPFCAEMIRVEAIKCKHCGSMLNKPPPVIQQTGTKPGKISPGEWLTGEKPGKFSSREWLSGVQPGKFSCPSCHSTATNCQRAIGLPIIILMFVSCGLGLILLFFLPYSCTCLNCGFKWKS